MIHKKTSKPAFVADLLVKIIKYLYGRDVDTLFGSSFFIREMWVVLYLFFIFKKPIF